MPEKIEASLNWPETGLHGVPESDNGLVPPAAPTAAEGKNGADKAKPAELVPSESLYDPSLEEGLAVLTTAVHELAGTAAAARADGGVDGGGGAGKDVGALSEALQKAEETLRRLEESAGEVSVKLAAINGVLDERLHGLRAPLEFGSGMLPDDDSPLALRTEFKGGIPGIHESGTGANAVAGSVNWPPWGPTRKRSMWSRMVRSNIAIPLLLIAVIAVGGATYKIVKHETVVAPPAVPGVSQTGISSYGSVKVIDGATCRAGTSTATVQLAAAQAKSGTYLVSIAGTLSNGAQAALRNVVVGLTVTYADGNVATETAPVLKGSTVDGRSTKTFYVVAQNTEGSVPPTAVSITQIGALPAQPACTAA